MIASYMAEKTFKILRESANNHRLQAGQQVVVFSDDVDSGHADQTWTYDGQTWRNDAEVEA